MQKKLLIGLLVLILLLSVACTMVACDMIGKFFNKENGGNSSAPSSSLTADTATTALRNAGYDVEVSSDEDDFEDKPDGLEVFINAYLDPGNEEDNGEFIYLFFFVSESKAKVYMQTDDWAADLEDALEDAEEDGMRLSYGRSGKYLYIGTKGALNVILNLSANASNQSKSSDVPAAELSVDLTVEAVYDTFYALGYDSDYLTEEDLEEGELAVGMTALFDADGKNKSEQLEKVIMWFFDTPENATARFNNKRFKAELDEEVANSMESSKKANLTYGVRGRYIYLASAGALKILSEISVD